MGQVKQGFFAAETRAELAANRQTFGARIGGQADGRISRDKFFSSYFDAPPYLPIQSMSDRA